MTADPPAEPSPRALGESLAALAEQVAVVPRRGRAAAAVAESWPHSSPRRTPVTTTSHKYSPRAALRARTSAITLATASGEVARMV